MCTREGVPDETRSNPRAMRDVFQACAQDPAEKMRKINELCGKLFSKGAFKDWGLSVDTHPVVEKTKVLRTPMVEAGNGQCIPADNTRRVNLGRPEHLNNWVMIHHHRNERLA